MYYLPENYKENTFIITENYDDTNCEDEYQDDVYKKAKELFLEKNMNSVLDIGCGSGFKLMKYFGDEETVGLEIGDTLAFLRKKYAEKQWMESNFDNKVETSFDLVICSDVIEHLPRPEQLLEFIDKIKFKTLIISTPEREEVQRFHFGKTFNGPPSNKHHVREWNFKEFAMLLGDYFEISEHFLCKSHKKHNKNLCQVAIVRRV